VEHLLNVLVLEIPFTAQWRKLKIGEGFQLSDHCNRIEIVVS